MTNPQPPQWLIDAIFDWVNKSMLESPPKFDNPVLAAAITAKFEQACGEDEDASAEEGYISIAYRNALRSEQRIAWYTDASRIGDVGCR